MHDGRTNNTLAVLYIKLSKSVKSDLRGKSRTRHQTSEFEEIYTPFALKLDQNAIRATNGVSANVYDFEAFPGSNPYFLPKSSSLECSSAALISPQDLHCY